MSHQRNPFGDRDIPKDNVTRIARPMGLDVSAYSRIKKVDCLFDADGEPVSPTTREPLDRKYYFQAYVAGNFPGRADDIEHKAIYSFDRGDSMRAGSYGGYNGWRNDLARIAGYPKGEYEQYGRMWDSYCVACWNGATGPFSELINFSACEGIIGTAVSKKLAADFAAFQDKADTEGGYFAEKYREWRKMFDCAANGGCVRFH